MGNLKSKELYYFNKAEKLFKENNFIEALYYYVKSIENDEVNYYTLNFKALELLHKDFIDEALKYSITSLEFNNTSDNYIAYFTKCKIYCLTERYFQAINSFDDSIVMPIEFKCEYLNHIAYSLINMKLYREAEEMLNRIITLDANNANAYCNLGSICFYENDYETALDYLKFALKLKPNGRTLLRNVEIIESHLRRRNGAYDNIVYFVNRNMYNSLDFVNHGISLM